MGGYMIEILDPTIPTARERIDHVPRPNILKTLNLHHRLPDYPTASRDHSTT